MLWDDEYLYIGAELEEPHVWGTLTEHDCIIFQDNDFEVFLDPDGDLPALHRTRTQPAQHGLGPVLTRAVPGRRDPVQRLGVPRAADGIHIRRHAQRPVRHGSRLVGGDRVPVGVAGRHDRAELPPSEGDQIRIGFSRVEWHHEIVDGEYRKVPGLPEDNWVWTPTGVIDMHRPERWGVLQFTEKTTDLPSWCRLPNGKTGSR